MNPGLDDVIAAETVLSHVDGEGGRLVVRGFELEELRYVNPVGALGWLIAVRRSRRGAWPSRSFRLFDRIVPLVRPLDAIPTQASCEIIRPPVQPRP